MLVATVSVPVFSVIFMVISVLLMVIAPVALMMYVNMRFRTLYGEVAKGAIGYILIVLLFSGCLSQVVFSAGGEALINPGFPRMIVSVVIPVSVELFGLAMVLGRRIGDKLSFGRFMQYGCGFAMTELLLVAAGSMVNKATYAITYMLQGPEGIINVAGEELGAELVTYVELIAQMNPFEHLLPSIEGLLYAGFRVGVVMMIYMMMAGRMSKNWLGLIYLMYVGLLLPTVMVEMGVFKEVILHVLLVVLCAAYIGIFIRNMKMGCREEWLILIGKEKLKKK